MKKAMELSEIAAAVGVSVVNLSQADISKALAEGRVSPGEAERLRTGLKQADGIWQRPDGGKEVAASLW